MITVVGSGSVSVTPDTAEWSFGVQTAGDTANAALGSNSRAIVTRVASEALWLVAIGSVVGMVMAIYGTKLVTLHQPIL